jgi:hypothetical protein
VPGGRQEAGRVFERESGGVEMKISKLTLANAPVGALLYINWGAEKDVATFAGPTRLGDITSEPRHLASFKFGDTRYRRTWHGGRWLVYATREQLQMDTTLWTPRNAITGEKVEVFWYNALTQMVCHTGREAEYDPITRNIRRVYERMNLIIEPEPRIRGLDE